MSHPSIRICDLVHESDVNLSFPVQKQTSRVDTATTQTPTPIQQQQAPTFQVALLVSYTDQPGQDEECVLYLDSPTPSLLGVTNQIHQIMGVPKTSQKIVAFTSPRMQHFDMRHITTQEAQKIIFPPQVAFRLFLRSRRVNSTVMTPASETPEQIAMQETVRSALSAVLRDESKQISLSTMAKIAKRSKSALSLWHRRCYVGNNMAIAKSVEKALDKLHKSDFAVSLDSEDD